MSGRKGQFTFHGRSKMKAGARKLERKCGKGCFILPKKIGGFFQVVKRRRG